MESYGRFAGVYDVFMDNVNYREWADYIIETLAQDGIRDGLVLELGCGTGTVTEMLADAGYDMIGIDNSEEMLAEAMRSGQNPVMIFCIFCRICRILSCMVRFVL